jgi:hypothetical protein
MTLIEAAKQALAALEGLMYWDNSKSEYDDARTAITALRTAIEAAEKQEPVADDLIASYEKGFRDGAAQRQPLMDEQIIGSWEKSTGKKLPSTGPSISQLIAYTRAVERAHGIKGEKT